MISRSTSLTSFSHRISRFAAFSFVVFMLLISPGASAQGTLPLRWIVGGQLYQYYVSANGNVELFVVGLTHLTVCSNLSHTLAWDIQPK
jgi:hypothetical protein